ncbi:cytochrome b [Burkholderia multivorans]|uniref:cytochrome b n=1 Tax=Burkholderia multivorans TaxID=87883 RepID=UPI001C218C9F|nr:cytochrome b [Burkholderia multivorans]MBU9200470.1 cytochrome b [Burkholderia multivorans]MDN8078405.1 cytochrome b [Burkholderia multivorans]
MKYPKMIRGLHWLMAVIFLTLILAVEIPFRNEGMAIRIHKSLGLLAFALVVLRLITRALTKAPTPSGSALNQKLAQAGHAVLYVLMVSVPLTMLVGSLYGHGLDFFLWHFKAPWHDTAKSKALFEVHKILANTFIYVVLGHIAAALWHHFVKKDGTLSKMAS